MNNRFSLQAILARNYILIGVLPVLCFGIASLILLSRSLTTEITTKNYALARSINGQVEVFLKEPYSLILQMQDIVSSPEVLAPGALPQYLEKVVRNYQFFEMVHVLDSDGKVTHIAPYDGEYIGTDMSRQSFYQPTLQSDFPYWSSTFISMRSGAPTLSLSVRTEDGMVVGYLNLVILSSIVEEVSNLHQYAVITDEQGTVIADYLPQRVKQRENLEYLHRVRESGEESGGGTLIFNQNEEQIIASWVRGELTGWKVFFLQHYDDAFSPLISSKKTLYIAITLTLIIALLVGLLGAKKTSNPLVKLLRDVRRVADGDYSLSPQPDGFLEIRELGENFRAMAESIQLREKSIKESEKVYRELVEALPYGLQESDLKGEITFTNSAYERIFECEKGEVIGQSIWHNAVTPSVELKIRENLAEIVDSRIDPIPHSRKAITAKGRLIDIQVDWRYKYDSDGELVGFTSVITDITDKKTLETNLRQAQKMEAIGTLAGGIAHDFNNILSAILGYSEMIREKLDKGSQLRDYQEQVIKASLRARDLVHHLLIFSRKKEQRKGVVDLDSVFAEAIKLLRATVPVTIEFELDVAEEECAVLADSTQIHQVMINLCTNAVHAMESTGGVLYVGLKPVLMEAEASTLSHKLPPGEYVVLTVKDTGQGIEPEMLERVFDPFFTTKEVGKGTGMGLSVVHGIVNSHGGAIDVESKPGEGTTFRVYFPRIVRKVEELQPKAEIRAGSGQHILIVDDEQDITFTTSSMLEDMGYRTTVISDSRQAFKRLSTDEEFDLLITDQTMPGFTGLELASEARRIRPDLPIMLCTGYSATITIEQLRNAGVAKVVMKPLDRRTLLNTVADLLIGKKII